jgi:polyribonucleotide nucleotidyltransferase
MIEAWGEDVSQSKFTEAIEFGSKQAYKIVKNIQSSNTVSESRQSIDITTEEKSDEQKENIISIELDKINNKFYEAAYSQLYDIFTDYTHDKRSRDDAISMIRNSTINAILKNENKQQDLQLKATVYNYQTLSEHFMKFTKNIVRNLVLEESKRVDGRSLDELRPITCKTNLYKALHGSALFQRGQTQVLCSITFDSPESMYKQDAIFNMMSPSLTNFNKNFMLHYEFPSYAINEISRIGGRADRREIGHGALAEKSVYPMMPNEFPFTVRALCEVLESNGSSSMASVCATSMALMDAGVPIKRSVCGVAMGIITKFDETKENLIEYKILTDISGFEDYMGDMDFKIAGTQDGITAIQVR